MMPWPPRQPRLRHDLRAVVEPKTIQIIVASAGRPASRAEACADRRRSGGARWLAQHTFQHHSMASTTGVAPFPNQSRRLKPGGQNTPCARKDRSDLSVQISRRAGRLERIREIHRGPAIYLDRAFWASRAVSSRAGARDANVAATSQQQASRARERNRLKCGSPAVRTR